MFRVDWALSKEIAKTAIVIFFVLLLDLTIELSFYLWQWVKNKGANDGT